MSPLSRHGSSFRVILLTLLCATWSHAWTQPQHRHQPHPSYRDCSSHLKQSPDPQSSHSDITHTLDDNSRRSFMQSSMASLLIPSFTAFSPAAPALASEVRGPIEVLRPATRARRYIHGALQLAEQAKSNPSNESYQALLDYLLTNAPKSFVTKDEERLGRRYLEINTSSAWQKARRKEREQRGAEMGIDYTTPYDRVNTLIQGWGDNSQWRILRQRQSALEQANPLRRALNIYTNNLVFADNYQLTADKQVRQTLIRNDALPNVNAVVTSDLDLRDLQRNAVLQNMDDARAEIQYQLRQETVDIQEVVMFLQAAENACNEWFALIPEEDVKQAAQWVETNE